MNRIHLDFWKLKPERFFVVMASFFGLLILFITPPFQAPDEFIHFYRAYQVSEGRFFSVETDDRRGGYLPTSLIKMGQPFYELCGNQHHKADLKTILEQAKIPLNPQEKVFTDFPNTAVYSTVSYLPQSISIFVLRKLNLHPMYIFYGARLFTLFFWIAGIYFVIKIIPFYKWLFTLLALLPMSLYINMSLSADVATNLLSFILIACLLRLAFTERIITRRHFSIIIVLIMLLALAKLVYTPLIFLFLLIPQEKFETRRQYYFQLVMLFTIAFGTCLFWSHITNKIYLPYSSYNSDYREFVMLPEDADMHKQTQYILSHGFYIFHVFSNSVLKSFDMYFEGYIGTFGWLDTKLPMWLICLNYLVLFTIALSESEKRFRIKLTQRIVFAVTFLILFGLILLSQHLTWDVVGGDHVANIQGRYLIPVVPLLFMLFYNTRTSNPKIVIPLAVAISFLSLSITIISLHTRFYN